MRQVKTRQGTKRHQRYPLNEFPEEVIQEICKRIVHLKAVGRSDMSGDEFSRIFADSISGESYGRPLGIADVAWNGCCWSVKTVQQKMPHEVESVRLISGRNSPIYSAGIFDHSLDLQQTGTAVLDIYNTRIEAAREQHDDIRLAVLIRNMAAQEFTLFERSIAPVATNNYIWKANKRQNLIAYQGSNHVFTWQPHGAQFTIHEPVPEGAIRFRIVKQPSMLEMSHVLNLVRYEPDWVEIY